jgi:DtxR family Mn-dependent transcriptional regulator
MPSVTQAVEDYLKAIWRLSHEGGERVSVGDIASELKVSAPSVTSMVRKLKTMRLLNYERYGGVTLTPRGRKIALEIVRHHRLWELYLYMRLGVPLELVDGEAERLEHVLSDDMEELLTRNLGDPTHDPHGDPIPSKTGALAPVEGIALGQLETGTHAIVARVSDRNPEKLRYLVSLGLLPGARIEVEEKAPFRGPLTVRIGGRRRVVGADLANLVIVRGAPQASRSPGGRRGPGVPPRSGKLRGRSR